MSKLLFSYSISRSLKQIVDISSPIPVSTTSTSCRHCKDFSTANSFLDSSLASSRPMESRTGRSKQRYNEIGERLVAGVVPLNESKTQVLLIRSDTRSNWVLPKGGWELDESIIEAAKREAWEEAGIICTINYDLGEIKETRPPKHLKVAAPKALYQFFEVTVIREEAEWPESHKRIRHWASYTEAKEALRSRPELIDALDRSSIRK